MSKKYDDSLLTEMKKNEYETIKDGVKILVKPIPEGGNDGDVDPRIYKSMRFMPLLSKFMKKPKKDATTFEKILPIREMFGEYKGEHIVTEGIDTQNIFVGSKDGYEVPVRIYKRENPGNSLPILVYFHGGGFFGGGLHIVEEMCKVLVRDLDSIVLSVDYRLCPENHYPAPFDDCWAVTKWAYDNGEKLGGAAGKIAVSGDSAGGNLAAAITLKDREEKTGMIGLQALIFPAVNISGKETKFYKGTDPSLYHKSKKHRKLIETMYNMMGGMMGSDSNMLEDVYLQGNLPTDHIYASPILDDFHDLPPTLLAFGEHDFLVFEDFAYARHATEAGVDLKTIVYRGVGHGFADQLGVMPQAEDLISEIAKMMKKTLVV